MDDLIYDQTQIPKEQWRYGLRSSAATGCGWIATYNALRLLGYRTDIEKLIASFERMAPLIHGNAGTLFFAPAVKFRRWGFPTRLVFDPGKFDEAAKAADVCILFYRWRKGLRLGAHFVAVRREAGGFVGYNTFRGSTGPNAYGESLEGFLKRRGYFTPVLITIQNRKKA